MTGLSSKLELMITEMKQRAPRDADEWINSFVALADRFPACIVITDMTIAGAPMIFVNRGTHAHTPYCSLIYYLVLHDIALYSCLFFH
jgi:hypothetical protein